MEKNHPKISFVGLKALKETLVQHIDPKTLYQPASHPRELIHAKKYLETKRNKHSMHIDIDSIGFDTKTSIASTKLPNSIKSQNTTTNYFHNKKISKHSSQKTLDTTLTKDTSHPTIIFDERRMERKEKSLINLRIPRIQPETSKERRKVKLSPLKSPPKEVLASIYNPHYRDYDLKGDSLWMTAKKKYATANKIMKVFESLPGGRSTLIKGPLNQMEKNDDNHIFSVLKNTKESLLNMVSSIDKAIENRKYKPELDQSLATIVQYAQKTRNIEVYLASLKTQGKILLIYSDVHRALNIFKMIKHIADTNKSFTNKLKAYKYLGKCFQSVGNYSMAIFYFVKLLQTAWFCNSNRYELLAYDLIGMQYFYMGEPEKAKYYHDKMMSGKPESKNSELRKLGIDKLINKILEGQNGTKKNFKVKTIEEELTCYSIPQSEDEFELPSPRHVLETEPRDTDASALSSKKTQKNNRFMALKKMFDPTHTMHKKSKSVPRFHEERDISKLSLIIKTNESISNPPKQPIMLSHMSPNRFLNNFHMRDPRLIASSFINKGDIEEGLTLLDYKSVETIRKKLERLKQNVQKALNQISTLDKFSNVTKINKTKYFSTDHINHQIYYAKDNKMNEVEEL